MFTPGDIVVCVDDSHHGNGHISASSRRLLKGRRYTLRWVGFSDDSLGHTHYAVRLVEISNSIDEDGQERAWAASRFRKIQGPDERAIVAEMRKETVRA